MDAQLVFLRLFFRGAFSAKEMAGATVNPRDLAVGKSGNISVALGTVEESVNGLLEESTVYVPLHAFLAMAIKTDIF